MLCSRPLENLPTNIGGAHRFEALGLDELVERLRTTKQSSSACGDVWINGGGTWERTAYAFLTSNEHLFELFSSAWGESIQCTRLTIKTRVAWGAGRAHTAMLDAQLVDTMEIFLMPTMLGDGVYVIEKCANPSQLVRARTRGPVL